MELGRTPVAVVCAGVKSILDIGKTLEVLVGTFDTIPEKEKLHWNSLYRWRHRKPKVSRLPQLARANVSQLFILLTVGSM